MLESFSSLDNSGNRLTSVRVTPVHVLRGCLHVSVHVYNFTFVCSPGPSWVTVGVPRVLASSSCMHTE